MTPIKILFATVVIGAGLGATGVAYAADDAILNRCWGQITKQFAALDDGHPGIGDHAKDPPGFEPGDGGREGVGNVSKDDHAPLSEGGQGVHAIAVGDDTTLNLECEGAPVP